MIERQDPDLKKCLSQGAVSDYYDKEYPYCLLLSPPLPVTLHSIHHRRPHLIPASLQYLLLCHRNRHLRCWCRRQGPEAQYWFSRTDTGVYQPRTDTGVYQPKLIEPL